MVFCPYHQTTGKVSAATAKLSKGSLRPHSHYTIYARDGVELCPPGCPWLAICLFVDASEPRTSPRSSFSLFQMRAKWRKKRMRRLKRKRRKMKARSK